MPHKGISYGHIMSEAIKYLSTNELEMITPMTLSQKAKIHYQTAKKSLFDLKLVLDTLRSHCKIPFQVITDHNGTPHLIEVLTPEKKAVIKEVLEKAGLK